MTKSEYAYDPRQYDPAHIIVQQVGSRYVVMDGDTKSETYPTRAKPMRPPLSSAPSVRAGSWSLPASIH